MGEEAVSPSEETQDKQNEPEPVEADDKPKEGEDSENAGDDQEAPESQDAEGGEGETLSPEDTQRDIDKAVQKRLRREKRKSAKDDGDAAQTAKDLTIEKEKNKLLTLALEQQNDATKAANLPPNPDDFEGADDPKYIEAVTAHTQKATRAMVREEVQQATADTTATQNEGEKKKSFERRNADHIRKSIALDASDYNATEDAVIDIIGQDMVDHIITATDDAHLVLYYLGKNVHEAESLKDLLDTDLVKGVMQIGRLEAIAKGSPIVKSKPTPDPDEELKGGSPSAAKTDKFQRELDKAREAAGERSGDMQAILDIKKRAKKAGVTVS